LGELFCPRKYISIAGIMLQCVEISMRGGRMYKCRLRVIFAEREIKQTDFSKLVGIATNTLSGIVNGRMPTFEVALRIGEALNLPVEQIWVKEKENDETVE
jgi:putative transcriptional regulator